MLAKPTVFQAWSVAARLRTVPIPLIQVLTGTALAYSEKATIDWWIFLCTCLVGIFITIGTNLINDVIDFEKGADKAQRKGFLKVISAGLIPKEHVQIAGVASFVAALLFALPLAWHAGWAVFGYVLLSVVCGYCYTGGPYPISYLGLSEIFILLFYGFVCVGASYYVQTGTLSFQAWLCAFQMGLLAILPNALNNLRDVDEDAAAKKCTLAVRFGRVFAQSEISLLIVTPFAVGAIWAFLGKAAAALFPLLLLPLAGMFLNKVWKTQPGNLLFGLSVILHFLFGIMLVIGLVA